MASRQTPKGLDAAAAQQLIELALKSLADEAAAAKARPVLEAALELARESSLAAGKRTATITSISLVVGSGDDESTVTIANEQPTASGPDKGTVTNAKTSRTPIAYGGTGYACVVLSAGPPPVTFCVYW
jgi:hypothetical protein